MVAQKKSTLYCSKSNSLTTKRLFDSIRRGEEVIIVQDLLQEGIDMDARDSKGRTSLLFACSCRRKKIVDLLIKTGASVDGKCNTDEYTVLHHASRYGWTKIVRSLVKKVRDLNVRDIRGDTAIHHASRSGHLKIVKYLMRKGAIIDFTNLVGFSPLLCAAQFSKKGVFDLLLNSGANVNGNERLLLYCVLRNSWKEVVQYFVKKVPYLNNRYVICETALDVTSSRGHLEVVKCLVEEGTDNHGENEKICQEALYHASFRGHLEVVKWLVKNRGDTKIVPNLSARHKSGYTALYLALHEKHVEVAKYLVEEGVDTNIKNYDGSATLHLASMRGDLETVNWLVENRADINVRTSIGDTPLMLAVEHKNKALVDLLIHLGANEKSNQVKCSKVLDVASVNGLVEIVQSLVQGICDLEARNEYDLTPLGTACFMEHFETAQALLRAGANWDAHKNGKSLIKCFAILEQPEFIKLFIEHGGYLKPAEYIVIVNSSSLKVLQDVNFCRRAIVNKFNNYDLPELYKVLASESLPLIQNLKIVSGSEVAQAIERTVAFDIQTKGHCNVLEARPMALGVFSVRSVMNYFEKQSSELKNRLKRPATFDSVNDCPRSSKSRHFC